MLRGRQHGEDDFHVGPCQFGGRGGAAGALIDQGLHGAGGKIEDGEVEASLEQVGGHWAAHVAETDEADAHGDVLLVRLRTKVCYT
ncbi:hypothetical protein D9M71_826770 [compost metagenome]